VLKTLQECRTELNEKTEVSTVGSSAVLLIRTGNIRASRPRTKSVKDWDFEAMNQDLCVKDQDFMVNHLNSGREPGLACYQG